MISVKIDKIALIWYYFVMNTIQKHTSYYVIAAAIVLAVSLFLPGQALAAPSAPENITIVKGKKAKNVRVTWDAVDDADWYNVEWFYKNGEHVGIKYRITDTEYTLPKSKLKTNTKYYVRVRAYDADYEIGDEPLSPLSGKIGFRTKPAKVKNITVTGYTDSKATIYWNKPPGKIRQYYIQVRTKKGKKIKTIKVDANGESVQGYNITGLKPSKAYKFKVRAVFGEKNKGLYSDYVSIPKRS